MDDVLDVTEQDMKLVNLCKVSAQSKRLSEIVHSLRYSICFYETYEFPSVARGIMWSRNGAVEFLKNGSVIAKPVDHFFKDWLTRNKGGYCLGNAVVKSMGFTSDIGSGNTRGKLKMIEAIRHNIARGKRDLLNYLIILKRKFKARYDKEKRFSSNARWQLACDFTCYYLPQCFNFEVNRCLTFS